MIMRQYMDHETGIVGIRRRISRQMMREYCDVPTVNGRRGSAPTTKAIRIAIDHLIKAGLIQRHRDLDLVFSVPFAAAHFQAPKRWGRGRAAAGAGGGADNNSTQAVGQTTKSDATTGEVGPEVGPGFLQRWGLPHVVDHMGEDISTTLQSAKTPLPYPFVPSHADIEFAKAYRLPDPHRHVAEFVAHYQGQTAEDWHRLFRKWLGRARAYQRASGGAHAERGRSRKGGARLLAEKLKGAFEDD